jgi:hypothetical protein
MSKKYNNQEKIKYSTYEKNVKKIVRKESLYFEKKINKVKYAHARIRSRA